jgi:transposase-like protein
MTDATVHQTGRCELCSRRRVQKRRCGHPRPHCRTCCRFIAEFIDTGKIPRRGDPVIPTIVDIFLVVNRLGVSPSRAMRLLGVDRISIRA